MHYPSTWRNRGVLLLILALAPGLAPVSVAFVHAAPAALPIAVSDDVRDQPPGWPITVEVLANDTDTDGNPAADLDPASVRIVDPDTLVDQLTRLVVAGEGVWQVGSSAGTITFTPCMATGVPVVECTGPFVLDPLPIEYVMRDRSGAQSNPAIVTITVDPTASAPIIVVDDQATTVRNQPATIAVLANDFDVDDTLDAQSVTVIDPASHGATVVTPEGTVTYTPAPDYIGADQFDYRVCNTNPAPQCGSATVALTVAPPPPNSPPVVNNDSRTTEQDQPVTVDVLGNDSDPDGALDSGSVAVVTPPGHGIAAANADGAITYTPSAGFHGDDQLGYRVCDLGTPPQCGAATVFITVHAPPNLPPVANDDQAVTRQGQAVTIAVLANDVDPESLLEPASVTIGAAPAHGETAVNTVSGAIVYTPTAGYTGPDLFAYRVCDQAAEPLCDTAQVAVTINPPPNQPPSAVDDNAATEQGVAAAVQVLANDRDPEGELDPATLAVSQAAAHGATSVDAVSGTITYAPAAGYSGQDQFMYQVCDRGTPPACAAATVRATVSAPAHSNEAYAFDDAAFVRAGEQVSRNVLDNDLDPENDGWQPPSIETAPSIGDLALDASGIFTYAAPLTATGIVTWAYNACDKGEPPACAVATVAITVGAPNGVPMALDDVVQTRANRPAFGNVLANDRDPEGGALAVSSAPAVAPQHGQVTLRVAGDYVYTPTVDYAGPDRFGYTVCDPQGRCAQARVHVDVRAHTMANAAPYAQPDRAVSRRTAAVAIHVLANDGDLDGAPDPASVAVTAPPAHGAVTVNRDGSITYGPGDGLGAEDAFTYRVCDNGMPVLCVTANVVVDIASAPANQTFAFDDAGWTYANTEVRGNVLVNDIDLEGDGQAVAGPQLAGPSHGQLALAADGAFAYVPATDFAGVDQFTYKVCDDGAPAACATATVTVNVFPPRLGWDFGDAAGYPTRLVEDGPRHAIVAGLSLGSVVDVEADGTPDDGATTDDLTDVDDEAAVAIYPAYDGSGTYRLAVHVSNASRYPAQLVGWIDWNANFSFADAGERSLASVTGVTGDLAGARDDTFASANIPPGFAGEVTLSWRDFTIPAAFSPGKFVRLRLAADLPGSAPFFSPAGPATQGPATGGATVDAWAPVRTQGVLVTAFTAQPRDEQVAFSWTIASGTAVAGFNLLVERGGKLTVVNLSLIPSAVTSSTAPVDYSYAAPVAGDTFYLQVVTASGETFLHGPARLEITPQPAFGHHTFWPLMATAVDED